MKFRLPVKVVIDLSPQHLVKRLYTARPLSKSKKHRVCITSYWSGCLCDFWVMVLDIAAKVFKETHVGENSCGEKARSSSPLCLKCDYCNRMGHFVYTLLPLKVWTTQNVLKTWQVNTVKLLWSVPLIKGTPSIKRTLSRVPKLTSYISLYNEPLLADTLLSGRRC